MSILHLGGSLAVCALAIGAASASRLWVLDPQANESRNTRRIEGTLLDSPGSDVMRAVSFEHAAPAADLLWLQIVQELGAGEGDAPPSWDRLQRWANIAVDLDPRYYQVYFGGSIHLITYAKRADAAEQLLLKGRFNLPHMWELPALLAYSSYFLRSDAYAAAEYWSEAAQLPDAPRFLPSLAARARSQAGDEAGAIAMLEEMIESGTLAEPHRLDAEYRLKMLRSEPRLRIFDAACERFQAEQGRRPKYGYELVEKGYTSEPPQDLLENDIVFESDCRARTKLIKVRDDEAAKQRMGSEHGQEWRRQVEQ